MKQIVFTGGGSGGHVLPAITLIKELLADEGYKIFYVGSKEGIERELVSSLEQVSYFPISTGKLRRYFSIKNFLDAFKILLGFVQSLYILFRITSRSSAIFSTGGFVSVPVVIAAKMLGRYVFIHEQTSRIGLANKISSFFANKIFVSFEESIKLFPEKKVVLSGYPVRSECYSSQVKQVKLSNIKINEIERPILFVTGGGNGSLPVNNLIKKNLKELKEKYFIIHQVGKRFIGEFEKLRDTNYLPVGFINEEIIDIYKLASLIVSRSGAGTVSELIALNKRTVFIPLKIAQKNEQFFNALEAKKRLGSIILEEKDIENCDFIQLILDFESNKPTVSTTENNSTDAKEFILKQIKSKL